MSDYTNSGTADIDQVMAQNAFVIDKAVYENHLYMSPWFNVLPKSALPTGMGDNLTSLIYDRSIPTTAAGGSTVGLNWARVGTEITSSQSLNSSIESQPNEYAANETIGSTASASLAYVKWTKKLRNYYLEIARVRSPYVDINDLRSAANLTKQATAITNALGGATRWSWERRNQTEYERLCGNLVTCLTSSTAVATLVDSDADGTIDDAFYGVNLAGLAMVGHATGINVIPTANISNKILDRVGTRLRITSPQSDAYGTVDGAPVFALMTSAEASYQLVTESGYRDDLRESSKVDDLIKPLGVSRSFRGFYHIIDDTMPRFNITSNVLTRVEPLDAAGNYNSAYDSADYEAAYVLVKSVMEVQIPPPNVSAAGFSFDPVNHTGEFNWLNIKDEIKNPLGTIGFYMGTLASASLPKNIERGYVILFKRTSTTPAA